MPPVKGEKHYMRQRTTTQKLHEAISNKLLTINKVQCSYKSSNRIDEISKETFKDNLDYLCEAGIFADFIDWHFDMNPSEKDEYIFDSGAMNPFTENIITVYMRIENGASDEAVEKELLFLED